MIKRGIAVGGLAFVAAAGIAGAAEDSNVAPCSKAVYGHGSAGWRRVSTVAGPVGVRRHPLSEMSPSRHGLTAKMPILVEGRAPETVTVSVPAALRSRVFLYYGRIVGRDGKPTTVIDRARGYAETRFELCPDKPRSLWPGGIRVKGRAPVHLLVGVEGRSKPIPLRLGRPRVHTRPDTRGVG